jgi:DNA invertase Pin-like site-specific DNA recombinase
MFFNEQTKYIVGCYCRLSQEDDSDSSSVSIETQRKILEDYCRSNGYRINDFYCDDGFTGTNFERPSFKRLMSDIHNGAVNMVLVKDLSRLGRNYLETGKLIEDVFPELGVRFVALGDDVDTNRENLDLDLMLPMKNIFNQYYPADCSRKTRQALKTKAARGEFIGSQAPYGYKKSKADKHVLEIDENTAPTVRWIFESAAYQGYGFNKIARVLSEKQVLTPTAYNAKCKEREFPRNPYDWNLVTIKRMLENTTYLGTLVSGKRRKLSFKSKRITRMPEEKWIVIENNFPALIDERLWDDAHNKLSTRKRESKTGAVNIFAGLLRCDRCGYSLTASNERNVPPYFTCNTYRKKGKEICSAHYLHYEDIYRVVLADIREKISTIRKNEAEFERDIRKKLGVIAGSKSAALQEEREKLKTHAKELDRRFDILYEDRLSGLITDTKFKELSAKIEKELEKTNNKLSELGAEIDNQSHTETNVTSFTQLIKEISEIDSLDREILNRLIDKIVVSDRQRTTLGFTQSVTIFYRFLGCFDVKNVAN